MSDEYDIQFTGLRYPGVGESNVTLSHGVSPSTFTITVARGDRPNLKTGDVQILHNGRDVVRPFEDCAITGVVAADGSTFTVRIADRRRRWKNGGGVINGWYNKRDAKGKVIADTYADPQELLDKLLKKLGEKRFDLSQVPAGIPKDATPEAKWDHARPAEAMASLVDALGCRIVLGTDGRIKIAKLGTGRQLPAQMVMDGDSETIDNTDVPESLLFIAGRTLWQGYLRLEAVGLDLDHKIKPLDELSYKPSDGWYKGDMRHPETMVTYGRTDAEKKEAHRLAQQTVHRWYWIIGQENGKLPVPGYVDHRGNELPVDKRWQYLPLPGTPLFDTAEDADGNNSELEPYVLGEFNNEELLDNTPPNTRMEDSPSIDNENGVVRFSRPIFRYDGDAYGHPRLWLFCTYHVSGLESRIPDRWQLERRLSRGSAPGGLPVPVDDVERRVTLEFDLKPEGPFYKKLTDNKADLLKAADYYLDAKKLEVEPQAGQVRPLAGFHDISPDGAIQQVTWALNDGVAATTASRNTEHSPFVPPYATRRRTERTDAATRPTNAGGKR